ncbi:hypothetical protein LNQ49_20125 [Flavobacterium sp. F-65]|uniref:Uncharacterized protein n=1 Tax=Flavobacterium pisciphilum TaxID=2893755 RepID=A0ABS8MYP7_9FLAO|nr:hypothetical protein [Flavobacterium sp. F-65]MCC9073895.1 hypothetical protein [Flavobacterium sp. F-65]
MIYFFFKPKFHIKSYNENHNNLTLEVYSKFKKCGFININSENIVYQYSLGLYGKKGLIDLSNATLDYQDNKFLFSIKEGKNIISIECSRDIYNESILFFNNKNKIRNSPDYKSKRDLFFNK